MLEVPTPFGGQNRIKLTPKQYFLGFLGMAFFIGLLFLYGFEFKHFSNTFEVKGLVIRSLVFGALFGLVLGYLFARNLKDTLEQFKMYTFFVLLSIVFAPLFGSLSNRWLTFSPKEKVQVELETQEAFIKSRFGNVPSKSDGIFLFFYKDKKLERVKTKKHLFPDSQKGDIVTINTQKGLWGYEVFYED